MNVNQKEKWIDHLLYGGEMPVIDLPKVKEPIKIHVIQLHSESDIERKLQDSKENLCKAYGHYRCICGYK